MNFKIALGFCCLFLCLLNACGGTSDGSNLEMPDNMPPVCREIDFVEQPDMKELCGVRTVRFRSYRNIAKERYLIAPKDAKIVMAEECLEVGIRGCLVVALPRPLPPPLRFVLESCLLRLSKSYVCEEG